jgi:hypothetical protein
MKVMQDDEIDRLLAAAAKTAPTPSDALMQRVLADALALQPAPSSLRTARPSVLPSLLSRLVHSLGGGPALAGLGTAAAFGVALGYLSPSTMDYLTGNATDVAEFFPDADFLTTEG